MSYPKISIVTPCYNSEKYLEETILSVLGQNYPNLEYIIIDGGSQDNTLNIIKKYASKLSFWLSEEDSGMYEAINKGFSKSTGEIMGWIGSDDIYHKNSFFTIAELFTQHPNIKWLVGATTTLDEKGRTVYVSRSRKFTRKDFLAGDFKWLQQESCLWKRELWEKAGGKVDAELRYAGDFELWMRFFRFEKLYVAHALIGGFRESSSGQLSTMHIHEYLAETRKVITRERSLKIKTKEEYHSIGFNRIQQKFTVKTETRMEIITRRVRVMFRKALKRVLR